jgi:hypothetical protein
MAAIDGGIRVVRKTETPIHDEVRHPGMHSSVVR